MYKRRVEDGCRFDDMLMTAVLRVLATYTLERKYYEGQGSNSILLLK